MTDNEILAHILNACNPAKPAVAQTYVDCTDVRGGAVFANNLHEEFSNSRERIYALFTGHIGCGKSSELQHIADKISHIFRPKDVRHPHAARPKAHRQGFSTFGRGSFA